MFSGKITLQVVLWLVAQCFFQSAPLAHLDVTSDCASIQFGQTCTLAWRANSATSVFLSSIGKVPASGSRVILPRESGNYAVVAEGAFGVESRNIPVSVSGARGEGEFPSDYDVFRNPLTARKLGISYIDFLDQVQRILQDELKFSVHEAVAPGQPFVFVTNLAERDNLVGIGESRIRGRRLAYYLEVSKPGGTHGPIEYTVKTYIQYQRKAESTWRTDTADEIGQNQAQILLRLIENSKANLNSDIPVKTRNYPR